VSGGATCARRDATIPFPPPPIVLNETPTLDELATIVNRTNAISQLSSNSATVTVLSMPKVPRLTNSTLHLQRDRQFRLRASLPILLGAGVDMGSNDEVFWFEVPEGIGKTLYYARHDQYQQQLDRAILPVDPTWVMDALGLVRIDPTAVVDGPLLRQDGKLEVRSTIDMPDGVYQKVCFIDAGGGFVTDQLLYGPRGKLIAQSQASRHVYYDQVQCPLPHQVELTLSPAIGPPLAMRIEVGNYAVNQLLSGDPNLFAMPQSASNAVDLTTLSAPAATPPPSGPSSYSVSNPVGYPLRGTVR
jgi:hypothetical protein